MPTIKEVIGIAIGFVLVTLVTPVSMAYLASINSTFNVTGVAATYSAVYTIFSILLLGMEASLFAVDMWVG